MCACQIFVRFSIEVLYNKLSGCMTVVQVSTVTVILYFKIYITFYLSLPAFMADLGEAECRNLHAMSHNNYEFC
jgi:hypothetical protein